jgi:hypothetical protein
MTQPIKFSTSFIPPSTTTSCSVAASRRVRFHFDEDDKNRNGSDLNNQRHTRSSDDVRLADKNIIHRVEFQIPIHKGITYITQKIYLFLLLFKILIHG